jgi:hypothetical protein
MPRIPVPFARPRAEPIATAARAVVRQPPVSIALDRFRSRPTAQFVARLTVTALFAYLVALLLAGSPRPVLAPLTAVLVVQATLYQTIRNAVQRVASVVAGVLVALALSAAVGFTWWSLGLTVAAALVVGSVLKLGEHVLEVPISAMLILSLDTRTAVTERVVDTLIGAAAGLVAGLVLSPARTQPAQDAIADLSRRMAGLLDDIAAGLPGEPGPRETEAWLARARALATETQRVDDALGEAEDSLRLKPRPLRPARTTVPLRNGLETLEYAMVTIRGLARSLADDARLPAGDVAVLGTGAREQVAGLLRQHAAAVRAYGALIRADLDTGAVPDGQELEAHLAAAREQHEHLAGVLRHAPGMGLAGWRLRGEILTHLDRLTNQLQAEDLGRPRDPQAAPSLRRAVRTALPHPSRLADRRTDRRTERRTERGADRHAGRRTERGADRHADRRTDRQAA